MTACSCEPSAAARSAAARSAIRACAADGVRLGARRGFLEGGEVVGGQGTDELVLAERLEMPRRGEMPVAAVTLGQRRVRDLADERLDEAVLAAFRRPRVDLLDEDLAPDETAQSRLELGRVGCGDGRQPGRGEALAEDGRVLEEGPIGRVERVEACGDERVQGLRDGKLGQVADGDVPPVALGEPFVGDEHPDGLDRVQGDPVRAPDDRLGGAGPGVRDESVEQLARRHRRAADRGGARRSSAGRRPRPGDARGAPGGPG